MIGVDVFIYCNDFYKKQDARWWSLQKGKDVEKDLSQAIDKHLADP